MALALKSAKICFHDCTSQEWPAGVAVLEAIIHALRQLGANRPRICLATWSNKSCESWKSLVPFIDSLIELPAGTDNLSLVNSILIRNQVDCFFSIPTSTAMAVTIPHICWIYDFQHLHHPKNFGLHETAKRSGLFRSNAEKANVVFVYSSAVERDFIDFAPDLASKIRKIRLVPHMPEKAWTLNRKALNEYGLPAQFFFMPNQLQPHKNHQLVIEALGLLAREGIHPSIVCTGTASAEHQPLLQSLLDAAGQNGVADQLMMLGHVPRPIYFHLLSHCAALINPSLFEGFGLSAAEAGCLGTPMILSDIPAFREHSFANTSFFDPSSPAQLVAIMKSQLQQKTKRSVTKCHKKWQAAQGSFGREMLSLFQEACHG